VRSDDTLHSVEPLRGNERRNTGVIDVRALNETLDITEGADVGASVRRDVSNRNRTQVAPDPERRWA
jgi:hypothetical protein